MAVEEQSQPAAAGYEGDAVVVRSLSFSYPDSPPVVDDFSLSLPRGSRCLLCGANGAGEPSLAHPRAGPSGHTVCEVLQVSALTRKALPGRLINGDSGHDRSTAGGCDATECSPPTSIASHIAELMLVKVRKS